MKTLNWLLFFSIAVNAADVGGFSYDDQEIAEMHESLAEFSDLADKAMDSGGPDLIPQLGTAVFKTNMPSIYVVGDRVAVNTKLRTALTSIPGHAEYFRDRIVRAKSARTEADGTTKYGAKANDFMTELNVGLATLAQLPSPETVRVMGEFLFDDSVNSYPIQDNLREDPLSLTTVRYMATLPLVSKPADTRHDPEAGRDLDSWRQWYEEIKAGQRTFRFEGNPTEYDLNGPAPGQMPDHISRDLKRDAQRVASQKRPSSSAADVPATEGKSMRFVFFIAAMILLISSSLYLLRMRRGENS